MALQLPEPQKFRERKNNAKARRSQDAKFFDFISPRLRAFASLR
jgi:hypothetical protein